MVVRIIYRKEEKKSLTKEDSLQDIDYRDWKYLSKFISERGRIFPKRGNNISYIVQRKIAKAVKRARFLSLLPFVITGKAGDKDENSSFRKS